MSEFSRNSEKAKVGSVVLWGRGRMWADPCWMASLVGKHPFTWALMSSTAQLPSLLSLGTRGLALLLASFRKYPPPSKSLYCFHSYLRRPPTRNGVRLIRILLQSQRRVMQSRRVGWICSILSFSGLHEVHWEEERSPSVPSTDWVTEGWADLRWRTGLSWKEGMGRS